MEQVPFDETGVQGKLGQLYALDDDDLLSEAKSIVEDLKGWVSSNFILTAQQSAFVNSLTDSVAFSIGAFLAGTLVGRGEVGVIPISAQGLKRITVSINGYLVFSQGAFEFENEVSTSVNFNEM